MNIITIKGLLIFKQTKYKFLNNVRTVNFSNFPNSSQTAVAVVTIYKEKSVDFVKTKLTDVVSWYEQFTGLNDVKLAQMRVLEATQMLKEAQERRREVRVPLAEVQKKLQEFLPELRNTPRDDDRYIQLIKEEHKYIKEAKYLQERMQDAEKEERDAFELLSASLRSSHETERAQAERTKYWSLIASIIGTAIGVIGSTINNNRKMKKLQNMVHETSNPENLRLVVQKQLDEFAWKYSVKDDINKIYELLKTHPYSNADTEVIETNDYLKPTSAVEVFSKKETAFLYTFVIMSASWLLWKITS